MIDTTIYLHKYSNPCYTTPLNLAIDILTHVSENVPLNVLRVHDLGDELLVLSTDTLLYPQYDHHHFTLTPSQWNFLQREARHLLDSVGGIPEVCQRWQDIIDGKVPCGYIVKDTI